MIHRVRFFLKNCLLHSDRSLQSVRRFSTEDSVNSFALSYLINECGLRPEKAAACVKYARFKTPDTPNVVLQFLRSLGFSSSQIPIIIGRRPSLLHSDPRKLFMAKIDFLESHGFSPSDIAQVLLRAPEILHCKVEEQLLPNLNFVKSVLKSEEKVIRAVRRSPFLLTCNPESYLIPSIKILKESGVGNSNIIRLLEFHPMTMMTSQSLLSKVVERVKEMGMDPKLVTFGRAVQTIRGLSKGSWESKVDAYKKWGWSEEVILKAFTKSPGCMAASVKKIMENMDYYVNGMGFDALYIAERPLLVSFSLKKRIVPRGSVLRALLDKDLIESINLHQSLKISNELFEQRFLVPYKEEAPQLLELFRAQISEQAEESKLHGEHGVYHVD